LQSHCKGNCDPRAFTCVLAISSSSPLQKFSIFKSSCFYMPQSASIDILLWLPYVGILNCAQTWVYLGCKVNVKKETSFIAPVHCRTIPLVPPKLPEPKSFPQKFPFALLTSIVTLLPSPLLLHPSSHSSSQDVWHPCSLQRHRKACE
jgi:hypothetical protein